MNTNQKTGMAFLKAPGVGWFAARLLLLGVPLMIVIGCKSAPTVTGTVEVDGEPLKKGSIRFVPIDGTRGSGGGDNIRDGKYSIEKDLTVGKYKVEIQGWRKVRGQKTSDPVTGELVDAEVPIKFADADNLTGEVIAGPNTLNFRLKEKKR